MRGTRADGGEDGANHGADQQHCIGPQKFLMFAEVGERTREGNDLCKKMKCEDMYEGNEELEEDKYLDHSGAEFWWLQEGEDEEVHDCDPRVGASAYIGEEAEGHQAKEGSFD